MRPLPRLFAWGLLVSFLALSSFLFSGEEESNRADFAKVVAVTESTEVASIDDSPQPAAINTAPTRLQVLVGSLTVFTLAVIVGFEIIAKVPPTLHTPLMSGSNAISGITIVGALIAAGNHQGGFASFLGLLAVVLANINVIGGFCVTHRMLLMFKKK